MCNLDEYDMGMSEERSLPESVGLILHRRCPIIKHGALSVTGEKACRVMSIQVSVHVG